MNDKKQVFNWEEIEKDFKNLLDKKGKLSSRKLTSSKGASFREKYPEFNEYSFPRIFYIIKNRTLDSVKCKHCDKEAIFDDRLKEFKNHCFECRFKDREPWNKGLTKEKSESLQRIGKAVSKRKKGKPLTKKERRVIDNNAEINRNRKYSKEQFKKSSQTTYERHGVRSYLQLVQPKGLEAQRNKYGDKLYAGSEERKKHISEELEKRKKTCLERYGYESAIHNSEVKNKQVSSLLNNGNMYFGSEKHRQDLDKILEKSKKTNLKKYGKENPSQVSEIQQKRINTLNKNGTWFFHSEEYDKRFEEFLEKKKETCLKKYGVIHPMEVEEIKNKLKETNLEHWGAEYYFQSEYYRTEVFPKIVNDIVIKINKSKKENESFNISKPEKRCIEKLKSKFQYVFSQYSERRYPYKSDAYVPELDLFIEFNFHWTHGKQPFVNSKDNQKILDLWEEKAKKSEFYKLAIDVWTGSDVIKRNIGKNLNWIEFFNEEDFDYWLSSFPDLDFVIPNINTLNWEVSPSIKIFQDMINMKGSYKMRPNNKFKSLIIPFIFDVFYKKEKELLNDPELIKKLFQNRYQYLNKKEISQKELFDGLSKSGIYKGYSTFSPLVIKTFIEDFGINSIYDPCGGWGSRMLGAWNIRYHYNDANQVLTKKVKEMYNFYSNEIKSGKITFSSEDAAEFTPNEKFDAVFTCPPYFNIEDYDFEKDSSKLYSNYEDWLNIWWRKVIQKAKQVSNIFAYVISDKYAPDMNSILIQEGFCLQKDYLVTPVKKNHFNASSQEKLYIFLV